MSDDEEFSRIGAAIRAAAAHPPWRPHTPPVLDPNMSEWERIIRRVCPNEELGKALHYFQYSKNATTHQQRLLEYKTEEEQQTLIHCVVMYEPRRLHPPPIEYVTTTQSQSDADDELYDQLKSSSSSDDSKMESTSHTQSKSSHAFTLKRRTRVETATERLFMIFITLTILICSFTTDYPSSSSSTPSILFTSAAPSTSLHYPCLVCQHFVETSLQNYLLDQSLNRGLTRNEATGKWSSPIAVTQLPTAQAFCTSPTFQRLTLEHLYMDLQDESEITRLEKQLRRRKNGGHSLLELNDDESIVPTTAEFGRHDDEERNEFAEEARQAHQADMAEEDRLRTNVWLELDEEVEDMGESEGEEDYSVFAEMDMDLELSEKNQLDAELLAEAEAEAVSELTSELNAAPTRDQILARLQAKHPSTRNNLMNRDPIPDPIPSESVDYYYSKPRATCLVYEEGYCRLWDSGTNGTIAAGGIGTASVYTLPNPFSKAYIQNTPTLLARVTAQTRAKKRRQYLNILSDSDKERMNRVERDLLRNLGTTKGAKKPRLPAKYRKYESCVQLINRLREVTELPRMLAEGCTYRNMTQWRSFPKPVIQESKSTSVDALPPADPYATARAENLQGEYAYPCPPIAMCNGMKVSDHPDNLTPFCPTLKEDTRIRPIDNILMSIGLRGKELPEAISNLQPAFTREELRAIERARTAGTAAPGLSVHLGGVAVGGGGGRNGTNITTPFVFKPAKVNVQRKMADLGPIVAAAKAGDNKVSQPRRL